MQPRKIAPMRASMVAHRDENVAATKQFREGALNNTTAAIPQKKLGVVTRKRAVLMDRTNVSVKQTTECEPVKPIIKDENAVSLDFPVVKSKEKHELSFEPTLVTIAESEIYES